MNATKIGIIGCGNISDAYLNGGARSNLVEVVAVADQDEDIAAAKSQAHAVRALSTEALLAEPDIEIVVNLTVPLAHAEVSHAILRAGKHVYSEKPLAADFDAARAFVDLAREKALRVGCAPDTFLGGAHQAARRAVDEGRIGKIVGGAASVLGHGMEGWHPNPEFFFKRGGGPILDMGPYYITQLINLLGPVSRVTAVTSRAFPYRTVESEPLRGTRINVEIQTTVNGILDFASGANVALSSSWDVWKSERKPFELYGETGSMLVPDPNFFGGEVKISDRNGPWQDLDISNHPFSTPNRQAGSGAKVADYRMVGLIDMACAIRSGRPHRASGELALHALEVMSAFDQSSDAGTHIDMKTDCARPEPVALGDGEDVFL